MERRAFFAEAGSYFPKSSNGRLTPGRPLFFLSAPRLRICSDVLIYQKFTKQSKTLKREINNRQKCSPDNTTISRPCAFVLNVVQVLLLINYWFLIQSSDIYFLKRMLDPVGFLCIHCLQKMDEIVSSRTETKSPGLISCPKCTKARKTPVSGLACSRIIKFPFQF